MGIKSELRIKDDKAWSDQYLQTIKGLIGQNIITEAPIEEDRKRNTDLIVLKMDSIRIGCRLRRQSYFENYGDEFTIRASRPGGHETELSKIISGWGDFFFYGFGDDNPPNLKSWYLADLKVFRLWFNRYMAKNKGAVPGKKFENQNKDSTFRVFKWNQLPNNFIIANG